MSSSKRGRVSAVEAIRGISMMGVIGIHIGAEYLANPTPNIHLVALFDIGTRFSVPIFFFISAFGLFYGQSPSAPFSYRDFLVRRGRAVVLPYLVWSFFYILHDAWHYGMGIPPLSSIASMLFFGNAKYQLYFMVILIWFYLLMPLWRILLARMTLPLLAGILLVQVAFDYWSSFNTAFNLYVYGLPEGTLLRALLFYRLNYWVVHYIFIFLLGGYIALHFDAFRAWMERTTGRLYALGIVSLAALLAWYYKLILVDGYTPLQGIFTAHQLSPLGILYTIGATLALFAFFTHLGTNTLLGRAFQLLGKHSYFIYLAHPVAITYLLMVIYGRGYVLTAPIALTMYAATLALTLLGAVVVRKIGEQIPIVNELTIGLKPRK
ncbi:acyltransferase [Selenomonas sp. oral taxon 892 str. F0426]|uniref:acyltransferase n=1 Tax=Selenomonas sp. oral taxon 892 TaxID=1321785 RepID=UPI0003AD2131|nr:acyltransferase [Selenomonas sp. oral taxon 892]ERJ95543.1 acyltransferase [Selenomonas sp. oral taxon 892 str. F0426]